MKLANKRNRSFYITVNSKNNTILTTRGMVVITKHDHKGFTIISPEQLEENYVIPDNVTIKD